MDHFIVRGTPAQVNWTFNNIAGGALSLDNHNYRLYYSMGAATTLATGVTHFGNVLTWTFTPDEQWKLGHYDLTLEVCLGDIKIITVSYPKAFLLLKSEQAGNTSTLTQDDHSTLNIVSSVDFNRFAEISIGADGYWYINGEKFVDADGHYVKAAGPGLIIKDSIETTSDLAAYVDTAEIGDAYLCEDDNYIYIWNGHGWFRMKHEGGPSKYVIAWDGTSTPVVAKIPAGVTVTYNDTTYTGTLAAEKSIATDIYLVASATQEGEYDRYVADKVGTDWSWSALGSTQIVSPAIADDLTTNDASKALSAKQGVVLADRIKQQSIKKVEVKPSWRNILEPSQCLADKRIKRADGTLADSTDGYFASPFIPVNQSGLAFVNYQSSGATTGGAVYDSNKAYLRELAYPYVYQSGDAFVRCTFSTLDGAMVIEGPGIVPESEYNPVGGYLPDALTVKHGVNLLDPSKALVGYSVSSFNGAIIAASSCSATDYIPVTPSGLYCNKLIYRGTYGGWAAYDKDHKFIRGLGGSGTVTQYSYQSGDAYVRFTVSTLDGAMVNVGSTAQDYVPYSPIGGYIPDAVLIDDTHLANPANNTLARAVDVKSIVSPISYSEARVALVTSGDNQNIFDGYVTKGAYHTAASGTKFLLVSLDGVDKIKFLTGEKSTNSSKVGWAIGSFSGDPNSTLTGFTAIKYGAYDISEVARLVEYEENVPEEEGLFAAITLWAAAGVTTSNFYCKLGKGKDLLDVMDERIESRSSGYIGTTTSSVGNCTIHAAKEHTFNDGTPPLLEWFLLEEPMGKFYYSKDLQNKTFIFQFNGTSRFYRFGILGNGDIIAVRTADSLDGDTQSDDNRVNPYVWKADEKWSIQHEVDFGDGLKPCGWLSSKGFRVLPDGTTMFGEYTRPIVETSNAWKIVGDPLDAENWVVKKTFSPIGGDGDGKYKHIHCILLDHYTGVIYCTTGDDDEHSQIWYSTDGGDNWTEIAKKSSLNNGQQFRLCMITFTPEHILWGTDTPGLNKHVVYIGERDEDGILDSSTLRLLCNLTPQDGNYSTYGQAYLEEYDAVLLFDRQDGGGTQADHLPVYMIEVSTGEKHLVADLKSVGSGHIGFRTLFKEWYPLNGVIHIGFGYDTNYANCNKVCGNGVFSTGADRGQTTVNNLCLYVRKDGDRWTCRFTTLYV